VKSWVKDVAGDRDGECEQRSERIPPSKMSPAWIFRHCFRVRLRDAKKE
jgi:hypothetical protein